MDTWEELGNLYQRIHRRERFCCVEQCNWLLPHYLAVLITLTIYLEFLGKYLHYFFNLVSLCFHIL